LAVIIIRKPKPIIGRASADILKLKPTRETIHAVTVVPMLAPNMTPAACTTVRSPALTNDTTITVVADDDWMIPVTTRPVIRALNVLPVIRLSVRLSPSPAARWIPSDRIFIPYRNSPSEPTNSTRITTIFIYGPFAAAIRPDARSEGLRKRNGFL